MAQIRIDLAEPLLDGMDIKFKAPCDCTAVTGMVVYYPSADETIADKSFVFKDTHGNVLTGQGNLFMKNTYVKVIVDTTNGIAYIQNADTNGYLESRLAAKMDASFDTASRALISDKNGKVDTSDVTSTELGYLKGATGNIQGQLNEKASNSRLNSYMPLAGGAMTGQITLNGIYLTENVDYGTSFPSDAAKGRLYFKKVGS
jgi:hypothetical protein